MIQEPYTHNSLPEQLAGMWKRRKWLFIFGFFFVFPAGIALVLALPPLYRSSTTLLLGQGDISPALVNATTNEGITVRLDVINKAILSRPRLQELIERFDLYPNLREEHPPEYVIDRMRSDIGIRQEAAASQQFDANPTITLMLSYQNQDPVLAAAVANELAFLYGKENETLVQHRNARTTEFLRAQLEDVSKQMTVQETLMREFRNEHLRELPEQQNLSLATLERLNTEVRLNSEKQIQLLNQRDSMLAGSNAIGMLPGLSGASGLSQLEVRRMELAALRNQYTEQHPQIIRLKNEIGKLEDAPAQTADGSEPTGIASELAGLAQQQATLRASIRDLQGRIESTPGVAQELVQLNHNYDTIREQHLALQKRYQEARMAESLEQQQNQQFRVVEPAIPANVPVAPDHFRIILMGFVLSLGFAGGLALLAEKFDPTFHTIHDLRDFTNVPVLGSVARIETLGTRFRSGFQRVGFAIGMLACIVVLVILAHNLGKHGEELVWLMAGRLL